MTDLEIDAALVAITRQKCEECKARLDAIPKTNATERKAVQLEYGMYTFCGNAGLLFNSVGSGQRYCMSDRRYGTTSCTTSRTYKHGIRRLTMRKSRAFMPLCTGSFICANRGSENRKPPLPWQRRQAIPVRCLS